MARPSKYSPELRALKVSNGNKSRAAELLQVKRSTLGDRIQRCGLGQLAGASPDQTAAASRVTGEAEEEARS